MGAAQARTDSASAPEEDLIDTGHASDSNPTFDILQRIAAAIARTDEPDPVGSRAAPVEVGMAPVGILPMHLRHFVNLTNELRAEHIALHDAVGPLLERMFDEGDDTDFAAQMEAMSTAHDFHHSWEQALESLFVIAVKQTFPSTPEDTTKFVIHEDWSVSTMMRDESSENLEAMIESMMGGRRGAFGGRRGGIELHFLGGMPGREERDDLPRGFASILDLVIGGRRGFSRRGRSPLD